MNWELILGPEAEAEIAEASDWYDRRSPGLGAELLVRWTSHLRPSGKTHSNIKLWGEFRRARLRRFPYSLIYIASDRQITVVSCFHGRRKPKVWQERT